jgi:two-component system, chemotaxis family, sensor kinase CheA
MAEQLTFDIHADELDLFLEDVGERLSTLETGILALERAADPDALSAAFRVAHTLKAVAGTIGHHRMAELTHVLETLFDAVQVGRLLLTQNLTDELLATVDILKALRDEVLNRRPSDVDVKASVARLHAFIQNEQAPPRSIDSPMPIAQQLTPAQVALADRYRVEGYMLLEVEVFTSPQAFAPAARIYQAALALMEAGKVIAQWPELDDLSEDDQRLWTILAASGGVADVEMLLAGIADLAGANVRLFQAASAPAVVPAPMAVEQSARGSAITALPTDATGGPAHTPDKTVRISIERLDTLMGLVGELVTERTRLLQIEVALHEQYGRDGAVSALSESTNHLGRVIDQLQDEVMRARMLPISHLFEKFPRLVRDVARTVGKQAELVVAGEATELDRSIIDAIGDSLMHLLRNAVDHGIEPPDERLAAGKAAAGVVRLTAVHAQGQIVITVEDDGNGIDPNHIRRAAVSRAVLSEEEACRLSDDEAIDLIFRPNFSTAAQVTEVSGRGVGMDVVRANVERLSGSVLVESMLGHGTTFQITLPLTLAIVSAMLVRLGDAVYAIPLASITGSQDLSESTISTVKGRPAMYWRNSTLPLLDLHHFFAHPRLAAAQAPGAKPAAVTVAWGKLQAGLVVDKIIGKQDIVVKVLSPILGKAPGISGGAVLGDGRIALILDVAGLINAALYARQ